MHPALANVERPDAVMATEQAWQGALPPSGLEVNKNRTTRLPARLPTLKHDPLSYAELPEDQ
jgi:hypothetical protein